MTTPQAASFETRWLGDAIGAELKGLDLSRDFSAETYRAIRQLLAERGVLFFRDQQLSPAHHAAFAARFGEGTVGPYVDKVPGFPFMTEVSKAEDQVDNIGGGWHADQTFHAAPPWGTILVARELPRHGGDTLFASMAAAFEGLSEGMRDMLRGLRAVHGNARLLAASKRLNTAIAPSTEQIHPVVIRHPVTGRESLFVNAAYTLRFEGMTERESAPLLNFLFVHGQRPEYQCRITWESGMVVFWDNIQVWHYASNDYQGQRRVMHRIAIKGDQLLPSQPRPTPPMDMIA